MKFLVTGGAGFIGSHVCERLLAMGHSVWTFDDLNPFYNPAIKQRALAMLQALDKPFTFVHGNLTDRAALDALFRSVKFDQVIHLAARAGVRPSLQEPALYQRVDVKGASKPPRSRAFDRREESHHRVVVFGLRRERQGAVLRGPHLLRHLALRREQAGLRSARPRLPSCVWHGHRDASLFHRLWPAPATGPRHSQVRPPDLHGKPIPVFGDGSTARDYTYVSDTVEGILACTQKEFGLMSSISANRRP